MSEFDDIVCGKCGIVMQWPHNKCLCTHRPLTFVQSTYLPKIKAKPLMSSAAEPKPEMRDITPSRLVR